MSAAHNRDVMPPTNPNKSPTLSAANTSGSFSFRMDNATRNKTSLPSAKNTSQTLKSVSTGRQSVNKLRNQPKVILARSTDKSLSLWWVFGRCIRTKSARTAWSAREARSVGEKNVGGRRRSIIARRVQ